MFWDICNIHLNGTSFYNEYQKFYFSWEVFLDYRNITFLDNKTTHNLSKFLNYQVRKNLWSGVLNDNAYQSCGGALGTWKFPATKQVIFKILMLTNYQYFCMITQCKITWNKLIELEHVEKKYIYIFWPLLCCRVLWIQVWPSVCPFHLSVHLEPW